MYKIYTKNLYWPIFSVLNTQLISLTNLLMPNALVRKRIMMRIKVIAVLLIAFLIQVSAVGFAQNVTFSQKKASITQVFKAIKQQTGYGIVWPADAVKKVALLDVNFKDSPLTEVLERCLKDQPFSYTIEEKVIIIKEKPKSYTEKINNFFQNTIKVSIDVKGRVVDEDGKPLSGATIQTKNAVKLDANGKRAVTIKVGTTNSNGDFMLRNVDENELLLVSFIGYETREIAAAKDLGTIKLKVSTGNLMEVAIVSTGYQQIDKKMMTGAATIVKAKDLVMTGTNSIEQMLQGKIAGLEIVNNSGQVGKKQTVRVRGTSTMLGNQQPVWVVDGIIQEEPLPFKGSDLNRFNVDPSNDGSSNNMQEMKNFIGSAISWLNPYDIEDVTVLKDAASTAIYGVKAANGVIVINTKRGKQGRAPSISYSTSFSTQQKPSYDKMNLMNSKERVDVSREIFDRGLPSSTASLNIVGYQDLLNQYLSNKVSYAEFNAGVKQLEVNNTDWFDLLFVTPLSQSHNFSISGGGNASTYYGSFGYNGNKGTAKGNNQNGYMGSLNFTSNITPKFSISTRLSGNYTKTNGFYQVDPYQYASTTSRVIPAYNADGSWAEYKKVGNNGVYDFNIFNEIANRGNENVKINLNTAIDLKYELPLGFRLQSTFGAGYTSTHAESYATEHTFRITDYRGYEFGQYTPKTPQFDASRLPYGGVLAMDEDRNMNYTWRNALNYAAVFNQKHVVSAMVGMELRSNVYKGSSSTIYGYLPDRGKTFFTPPINTTRSPSANDIYSPGAVEAFAYGNTDQVSNYVSYYFTGAYSYDNRYVFSASLRGDASNRFGQDSRNMFNPIWALGAKWNVARERWFDKTDWFNDFSIRTSYGFQGNVAENYGPDLIASIPSNSPISPLTGEYLYHIKTLPYTNLRWEKTQTLNLGLDFSLFKNRVMASLDYYSKKSKDLIIMKAIPYEYGILQMPMNGGNLSNYGYEAQLTFIPVKTKTLTWSISVNSAQNYNKVTGSLQPNATWDNAASGNYYVEGYPVSSFWVFDYKGPNASKGWPEFNIPTTADNPNVQNDATAYMKYAGKQNADFTGGFSTSVNYKQLTVSTNMYASLGGYKLLAPLYTADMVNNIPNEYNNLSAELINRWRKPGDEAFTNIPSLPYYKVQADYYSLPANKFVDGTSPSPYTMYNYSTARLVNASYLRINNINISYIVPEKFAKRVFCKNLNIGYTFSNVYTFVSKDFKGVDPEVASGGQPLPKTHSFTLSATF
ncbi:SusC/RagA family TonB-linked outer membrane protein [Pedobacter punctiformis]|uniref:SusC/RagA family TonB-linked outer membrane protein n=1 Tax=Pedobacter punctiformis TaxID=3004097 RepID=A0ABT4LAU0_9SPHI|nr:SusC/RagA family TonB-linked outer membrane protein [Pedobacter sp. HCMS5-2]MCZ4245041.1 SusC/RagA family TonB-linked outer membrane protein [Pedobacter sp. HCMS5-2]